MSGLYDKVVIPARVANPTKARMYRGFSTVTQTLRILRYTTLS